MKRTSQALLFAIVMLPVSKVQAIDISSKVGSQSRFFTQDSQWQNSVMAETKLNWVDQSQQNSFNLMLSARYDDLDDERSYFELQEALWLHVASDWEFKAGIGKVFWGVTESNHLVDVINQTNLAESIDGEQKLGQAMLHATLQQDWGVVDAFVLPGFRQRIFAGDSGRLAGSIFVDGGAAQYQSAAQQNHTDFALRYSHTIDVFDFGISWFNGTNREPILLPVATLTAAGLLTARPYYDQMQQWGLDAQATVGDWLLKLESIARQDSVADFAAVTAGFEYTVTGVFGSVADLGVLLEYSRDTRNLQATTLLQNDVFVGLRLGLNDVQGTELLLGYIQDTKYRDASMTFIEGSSRLNDAWKLTVDVRTFSAREQNELLYGFRQDDYLSVSLEYYF